MVQKQVILLTQKDTKKKIQALATLETAIEQEDVGISDSFAPLFKGLVKCVQDNNFRVCLASLRCLDLLCKGYPDQSRQFIHDLLSGLVVRSGDGRQDVRNAVVETIITTMDLVGHVRVFQKRIEPALRSPKWRVRQSMALCFIEMIRHFGPIDMNGLSGGLTDLLSDSQKDVRNTAMEAMRPLQKCLGKSLIDILNGGGVRPSLVKIVRERLEAGSPTSSRSEPSTITQSSSRKTRGRKPPPKIRPPFKDQSTADNMPSRNAQMRAKAGRFTGKQKASDDVIGSDHNGQTGHNPVNHGSGAQERSISKELGQISVVLANIKEHDAWVHRRDALIRLRDLLKAGAAHSPAFVEAYVAMKSQLASNCADLRSSIVKEACDTVAFSAMCLGQRVEPMLPELFDVLLQLTINSKQIMADAGHDCVRTVIMSSQRGFPRVLTHFFNAAESRSAALSTNAMEYIAMALEQWAPHSFRSHTQTLSTCIRSALSNSCNETRQIARQAFFKLSDAFPELADELLRQLDPAVIRQLEITKEESFYFESKFASIEIPGDAFHPSHVQARNNIKNKPAKTTHRSKSGNGQRPAPKPRTRTRAGAKKTTPRVFRDRWDTGESETGAQSADMNVPVTATTRGAVRISSQVEAQNKVESVQHDQEAGSQGHRMGGGARRNLNANMSEKNNFHDNKPMNREQRSERAPQHRAQRILPRPSDTEDMGEQHVGREDVTRFRERKIHNNPVRDTVNIGQAIEHLRHGSWTEKAEQYRLLSTAITAEHLDGQAVVRVLREMSRTDGLDRDHHRVTINMLGFVLEFFSHFGNAAAMMQPYVDGLLPVFICLMAHNKESVRNLAADVLECFVGHYTFSELFPSIERVLGAANVRSQEVGLSVLLDCFTVAQLGSVQQNTVTQIFKRLLSLPRTLLRSQSQTAGLAHEILMKIFEEPALSSLAHTAAHRLTKTQVEALQKLYPTCPFFQHSTDTSTPSTSSNASNHTSAAQTTASSNVGGPVAKSSHGDTRSVTSRKAGQENENNSVMASGTVNGSGMVLAGLLHHLYRLHMNHVDVSDMGNVLSAAVNTLDGAFGLQEPAVSSKTQPSVEEVALHLLRKCVEVHPMAFAGNIQSIVASLFGFYSRAHATLNKRVSKLLHRCVSEITHLLPPMDCLQFLFHSCFPATPSSSSRHQNEATSMQELDIALQLSMFLSCVRGTLLNCDRTMLHSFAPNILPYLVNGAHHDRSDIRMLSIVTLSELSIVLGSLADTSLAQTWGGQRLSDVHFQLIWHFSKRMKHGTGGDDVDTLNSRQNTLVTEHH